MLSGGPMDNGSIDLNDPDAFRKLAMAHPERLNLASLDDAYLLHGTKAYSFGDVISLEIIDNLPESVVQPVLARMQVLYAEPSEEDQKKATEKF